MTDPTTELVIVAPLPWWRRLAHRVAHWQPRRLPVRARVSGMFAVASFLLAIFLAGAAYSFTRSSVVNQRDRAGIEQAYRDAQVAQNELSGNNPSAGAAIDRLQALGVVRFAINYRGTWSASSPQYGPDSIPAALQSRVITDGVAARMVTPVNGSPALVVGIPLTVTDATYFEFITLDDASSTLRSVLISLLFAAFITSLAGGLLGVFVASRAVRPLAEAAQAAQAITGGRLDTRLEPSDDPDLRVQIGRAHV